MKIFITGGTGLLGSHVAHRLRQDGHAVVALHRPGSDTTFLRDLGCELAEGDLGDTPDGHARRLDGCDALFHAAAHIYGGSSMASVGAVNVDGTLGLLQGANVAGVARVVHVSSVSVYGDPPAPITEDTPLDAPLRRVDYYGKTKRDGEAAARRFGSDHDLPVTVLRPPAIYGERDRLFVPKLVAILRQPVAFLLGSGNTRLAAVYAGNVADAVVRALQGRGEGGVFNVTEDVLTTQRTLYEGLAREMGWSPHFLSIPAGMARLGARVGDTLGIPIPGAKDLSLTRSVRLATEDNPYPSTRAREVLGWDPPFSLQEAVARTAAWLRNP